MLGASFNTNNKIIKSELKRKKQIFHLKPFLQRRLRGRSNAFNLLRIKRKRRSVWTFWLVTFCHKATTPALAVPDRPCSSSPYEHVSSATPQRTSPRELRPPCAAAISPSRPTRSPTESFRVLRRAAPRRTPPSRSYSRDGGASTP